MKEVSGTMLITLYARAKETVSRNPLINDPAAVQMISVIMPEIKDSDNPIHKKILKDSFSKKLAVTMSLRSRQFDRYTADFMQRNPSGTVINLGCGLDTRFDRIDNGTIKWFDIDLPEVIELRRRFLRENQRRKFIAASVLEKEWLNEVRTGGPYLVLAEGLFMYLTEEGVKALLRNILTDLGPAELVCEVTNSYWVSKMQSRYMRKKFRKKLGMTGSATFTFGIPSGEHFETWSRDYHFLGEWTYFDEKEKKLGWFNLFSSFSILRKVQWTLRYRLG